MLATCLLENMQKAFRFEVLRSHLWTMEMAPCCYPLLCNKKAIKDSKLCSSYNSIDWTSTVQSFHKVNEYTDVSFWQMRLNKLSVVYMPIVRKHDVIIKKEVKCITCYIILKVWTSNGHREHLQKVRWSSNMRFLRYIHQRNGHRDVMIAMILHPSRGKVSNWHQCPQWRI